MRNLVIAVAFIASTVNAFAQDAARLEQIIQTFVANGSFSGSVLIARGDAVVFNRSFGLANREWEIPNSAATRFRIASITKQFTAAAILLLQERGKLNIEDPVKKYVPEAPASWDTMTIFHLLTHTAGLPGLGVPTDVASAAAPTADRSVGATVARLMERPLASEPGPVFTYGNAAYFVLGHIIQKVSGQTYEQFLRENIWTPLAMNDTGIDNVGVIPRRAAHYTVTKTGVVHGYTTEAIVPNMAAGMYSTTEDLLRWQRGLFAGKVLSPASLQKMTTAFKGDYGLGVYLRTLDGRKAITHGGGAPPFANLTYFPETRTTVIVLGNLNIAPSSDIAAYAGAHAHGDKVLLPSERKAITVPASVLARYAGTYQVAGGQTMTIEVQNGALTLQPQGAPQTTLLAESATIFFLRDVNFRLEFTRDAASNVTGAVIHQGTRTERLTRIASKP